MRSRASDVMGSNTRSRSVDRGVSNSNLDISRLTRSITETSSRFNSLNRLRGSHKSSLDATTAKKSASNVSICSTLPTRGRVSNGRGTQHNNKYNFKADPCFTSNIEHLVYANSTRSSFNVKYGGNFPLSKNHSLDRRLPDEQKKLQQQMHKAGLAKQRLNDSFNRQPMNKVKSGLNSSSGGSRSFDSNTVFREQQQHSPSMLNKSRSVSQQPHSRQSSSPGGGARSKPQSATNSLTPSPTAGSGRNTGNAGKFPGAKSNSYSSKPIQSDISSKATGVSNTSSSSTIASRSRGLPSSVDQTTKCGQYEDTSTSSMQKQITTTTTILQETTPNRRNNVSILQVRSVSEPNPQQSGIKHQVNISTIPASRVSSVRNPSSLLLAPPQPRSNIPVYRYQSNAANLWKSAAGKIVTCAASNKAKLAATEQQANANANREMSPVRWCDEEVAGVYLGRSGWVQVCAASNQQTAAPPRTTVTKASSTDSNETIGGMRLSRPETLSLGPAESGAQFPRSSDVPSMSLPPQPYSRSVSAPVEPAPLMLSDDEDQMLSMHTPIISPPLAFQDEREARPNRNKLPRSNAFDFPDPDEVTRAFLQASNEPPLPRFSPTKKPSTSPSKAVQQLQTSSGLRGQRSSEESSGSSTGSFRTAASSGGMRSVTPSWRGGSGGGSGGGGGGGGRMSCGESCSSGSSSRRRSSSEESLSFMAGAAINLSPDATPKRHATRLPTQQRHHSGYRNNGVQHLSDTAAGAARRHHATTNAAARRTVTSPESSTSSASSSPARHERTSRNRRLAEPPHPSKSRNSSGPRSGGSSQQPQTTTSRYGNRLSPQTQPSQQQQQQQQRPTSPHVTRSTSLQLPSHADYPTAVIRAGDTSRMRAVHQERSSTTHRTTQSNKTRSMDTGDSSSLGWHQAELRAVTDYLSSARSRNAARALLLQRYLNQQGISPQLDDDLVSEILDPGEPSGRNSNASYNIVYVDNSTKRPPSQQQSNEKAMPANKCRVPWKRGSSAPSTTLIDSDEETHISLHNTKYQQCCNPATCDFWPECEHQSPLSNGNNGGVKKEGRKPYLCQIRPSLSYPSPCSSSNNEQSSPYQRPTTFQQPPSQQQASNKRRDRSITAPCSLDRVDEDRISPHIKTITIPKRDIYARNEPPCSPVEKNGFRNSSSDDLSTSADDLDDVKWRRKSQVTIKTELSPSSQHLTPDKSSDSDLSKKLSPTEGSNPSLLSPSSAGNRPHSADCLLRRRQYSSNVLKANSERNSPIVEESPHKMRDEQNDADGKGAQQRSLSLPKSFMSNRQPARPKIPSELSWQNGGGDKERPGPGSLLLPVTSGGYSVLSTPNTPGHVSHKSDSGNDKSCFGTSSKDRVSPSQQQPGSGHQQQGFLASALRHAGLQPQQGNKSRRRASAELSVLQKFKKSLTQRFTRKSSKSRAGSAGGDTSTDMGDPMQVTPDKDDTDSPLIQDLLLPSSQIADTDAYFKRIGPVWRHKDPTNGTTNGAGNKSCRNSKCSSGDSGFQMEDALKSLETESTPQELSPELQRRVKSSPATTVDNNKKTRPLSEVLNETFLEKYKLEGGAGGDGEGTAPRSSNGCGGGSASGAQVRRTHSDLGGSPLQLRNADHTAVAAPGTAVPRNVFKRQISSPSPLKMRPGRCNLSRDLGMNSASEDDELDHMESSNAVVLRRTSAASTDSNASVVSATPIQRQQQLRRSISQPMGINELSPLLRRRPSGVPSVVPRRVSRNRRGRARRRNKVGGVATTACSEDEQRGSSDYDEDDETDSECSSASDLSRKHSYEIRPLAQVVLAEAVWDHVTLDSEELPFTAGTLIEVVDCTSDKDWWFGHVGDKKGWFPAAFVRFRVSQDDTLEDCLASMAAAKAPGPGSDRTVPDSNGTATSPRGEPSSSNNKSHARTRSSVSLLSNDQVRASVVREILSTERDFVRNLTDVVEGYLWECRRRNDLFTSHQLANIFGNIEEILAFQSNFLASLEKRVNLDDPCSSCLGHTFLQHSSGFHVYSEYCNGHHIAQATLQELCAQPGYRQFFEACRLVRGLINISLDGFLLTPVQRICKYPLQLNELLKYTRADHPDYEDVRAALEAMRAVATLVNERKRRMESLEKLAAWQQRVEGWEGEDLIDLSSQLIHQGEAVRVTSGRWSSNVKLFLFDRQLLYCKRDLLRRGLFVYKGRIALDHCQVMDVPDGKDVHLGISVRHGIKLVSRSGPSGRPPVSRGAVQWLLLCFRSADEKRSWLHALTEERLIVQAEEARGLELEPSAREVARLLCSSQRNSSSRPHAMKPHTKGYSKRRAREAAHLVPHLATSETSLGASCQSIGGDSSQQNSLGRKVGNWFTFSSKNKQHRRSPTNRGGSLQQLLPP